MISIDIETSDSFEYVLKEVVGHVLDDRDFYVSNRVDALNKKLIKEFKNTLNSYSKREYIKQLIREVLEEQEIKNV